MKANNPVGADLSVCPINPYICPITKESILSKTHYGLTIYSHILRQYYSDKVVLRLTERDCGLCRNPFNSNKETLHIFIHKENVLGNSLDREFAHHEDNANAIPAGDAFDFAELYYKQQGNQLLQTLNKELNLRIGQQQNFYQNNPYNSRLLSGVEAQSPITSPSLPLGEVGGALFSFFKSPITNTKPHKTVNLLQIYNAIKGDYYKARTQKLRAILAAPSPVERAGGEVARQFKATNFDYCTFSGTFTTRSDKALIKHSGLLCIDFDHLNTPSLAGRDGVGWLRKQLLQDEYFDTQLLFVSPSGDGLKWIIPISPPVGDLGGYSHSDFFGAVANYISQTYGVEVDKSGKDISRACFLPHDPQAYINPLYLK